MPSWNTPQPGYSSLTAIAICIPIRDEAATLLALLNSLARQTGCRADTLSVHLFFDGCGDDGIGIAQRTARHFPIKIEIAATTRQAVPNAGRARASAMALGLADGTSDLILTTDADSVPADDWIMRSREALRHADVVAGRIVRAGTPSPRQDRVERYLDRLYALRRTLDPVAWDGPDTHHFTGGASLGFRARAYRTVGGFLPLASGEDARIADDASRLGLRVRRDPACVVTTSARRDGRASGGLALALRDLDRSGTAPTVTHPEDAAWQYRAHAVARQAYGDRRWDRVAAALTLSIDHVIGVARDCANSEAFAMRIVPVAPGGMRQISLDHAEVALGALEADRLDVVA